MRVGDRARCVVRGPRIELGQHEIEWRLFQPFAAALVRSRRLPNTMAPARQAWLAGVLISPSRTGRSLSGPRF